MAVLDVFLSPKIKKGKAHLRNLAQMALADGKIDDAEYEFLQDIAAKYGVSANEVDKLITIGITKKDFSQEKSIKKFEQIFDLVKMMMVDNNINANELSMCKKFAQKIGFAVNKVDELIDSIKMNISLGNSMEETQLRVAYLIKD
ncbi:MAG: hypothetical protein NW207_05745 [Cytophagales bacterium]|nr:hypothetical protein [Cytophagales bacterium]